MLEDVKKLMGILPEYTQFDTDIKIHIETVLTILRQMGVKCVSNKDTWVDTFPDLNQNLESIKTLVFMRVKMIFDPPQTSFVQDAYNKTISELEWRINTQVDYKESFD